MNTPILIEINNPVDLEMLNDFGVTMPSKPWMDHPDRQEAHDRWFEDFQRLLDSFDAKRLED